MASTVSSLPKAPAPSPTPANQENNLVGRFLLLLVLVGLAGVAIWGSSRFLVPADTTNPATLVHKVDRGEMLVTVTEDGNLESASNVDIKCAVAGGSSILTIVKDGSTVKKGDKIVELDSSTLEESINQQKIALEKARSAKIQAEKNFEVAKLAVREYLEGTFKQAVQDADAKITISLENQRSAQNSLEHAERMFRKGYVSSLELEGQKFAVERAKLELDSARTAKDVLENFTKVKTLQDLESQRDTAEAQAKSETAAYELEDLRLKRLEAQLVQCTIVAPQDGMVVYANEQGGRFGQQATTIEEGAAVRERQTILRLPDLSKMQVKVNVHESKVEQLRPGMRARIRILDRDLTGEVKSIANQPEPGGWMSANVKEYATQVRIDGQPEGLRPGMTAEVQILVAHVKDALRVPVAAVVEQRGKYLAWVQKNGGAVEKRELKLGFNNDQFLEVKDGLAEGEQVLLNPRAVVAEAREIGTEKEESNDVSQRFGQSSGEAGRGGPGGPGAAGGPGAGGPGGPGAGGPGAGGPGAGGEGGSRRGGPDGAGPGGGPGGPGGGGGSRGGGGGNLMQFDANSDGKLTKEELPEPMQGFFDRLDGNSDGSVDAKEVAAARQRMQGAGGPGGPGGGPGGGGPGGPGGPPQP